MIFYDGSMDTIHQHYQGHTIKAHVLLTPQERLSVWQKVAGMWKNKKPNPLKTLEKIRRGWERRHI